MISGNTLLRLTAIIALTAILVVAFSLASCGGDAETNITAPHTKHPPTLIELCDSLKLELCILKQVIGSERFRNHCFQEWFNDYPGHHGKRCPEPPVCLGRSINVSNCL